MRAGQVQIYTGNGKGKSTAAIGLAIRAAGHGMTTFIGQFMKGQYYGELSVLAHIDQIDIEQFGDEGCITRSQVAADHIAQGVRGLSRIESILRSGHHDIVVMDEICVAIWFGIVSETAVLDVVRKRPEETELVLTGRYAPKLLMDHADLVTQMDNAKHYFETRGIPARQGIEN